jgi:hypothetical protein
MNDTIQQSMLNDNIKEKSLGIAAAEVLSFIPEYHGKWYEGYVHLLECLNEGRQPNHCTFKEGVEFWSWDEAVRTIQSDAKATYDGFAKTLESFKVDLLTDTLSDSLTYGFVQSANLVGLSEEAKTTVLIKALRAAVEHVNKIKTYSRAYKFSSYSGRAMFGRQCVSVTVPRGACMSDIILYMGDLFKELGDYRKDTMGLDMVYYWPSIPCDEEDEDE